MTTAEALDLLDKVDLGRLSPAIRLRVAGKTECGSFALLCEWDVGYDADTGLPCPYPTTTSRVFTPRILAAMGRQQFLDLVLSCFEGLLRHELVEWFRVDGVRLREPHP